ncbi:hypothetical protein [Rhizobium sp. AP16]|uniref:hypothetical protein n=1 Tax=Rhizobium sp. AP16 TaxID=1144306 RepID=UPI00026ED247|nr:hypothetical protein [Rhizobium sp. AP16]EJK83532.1 hypothetical protein PMI03_03187 [Rhizobium sp. AP16]
MSFNFNPAAGETESSSAVDLRRRLAAAMMQQGMQSTPIQSPWQGVARLSEALMGGLAARRQAQQEQAANGQLMAAMTGQPYTPPAQSSGFLSKIFGDNSVPASGAQTEMAASSPATTTAVAPGTANDIQNQFLDTVKGGYDVGGQKLAVTNPYGLAAIAATGKAESGWSPQNAGSTWNDGKNNAGGIMSWNGPRLANLQKFAGGTNGTPQQQGQFFLQENPQLISALNNAKSVTEAQNIMNNAWAFKGYNEPGNANAAHRLALANGYLPQFAQAGASTAPVSAPTPIAAPAAGPTQVASLDPSAGMPVGNAPNPVGTAVPPPLPTANPADMSKVSPDQMQAMLGPQPTPGYRDPMVTTAYREPVPATPAAQAIDQQMAPAGADPIQTASLGPTNGQPAAAAIPSDATAGALPAGQQVPIPSPSPVGGLPAAAPAQEAPRVRLAQAMQSAPPQAPNVLANSPRAQALMQAMMNPNASPQVRQMAGVMFQNEMGKGQALYQAQMEQYIKQQDPQYQATLAKAQYEAAHLGEISPDTKATLAAQEQKMKFDAQQQLALADHNQQLKQSDPLQQANLAKTNAEAANVGVTNDIHDYEYYRNNEVKAGRTPLGPLQYQQELKKAGATTINTGDNSSKFQIKADEEAATRMGGYVSDGNGASQMLGDVQQLADLGPMIGTGKTAQFKAALGPYAQALGINVEGLGETQAYQSIIDRLAPSMRPAGSGSSSDTDVKMFLNSLPSIGNQPGGNQIITSTLASVQQHKMAAAEIAAKSFLPAGQGGLSWQEAEKQIRQLPNPYQGFNDYRKKLSDGGQNPLPSDHMNVPTDIPGVTIRRISK